MSRELRTVVENLHFSECPRWHDDRLFFSDFYLQQVLSVAYDGSDLRVEAEVPGSALGTRLAARRTAAGRLPARLRSFCGGSLTARW